MRVAPAEALDAFDEVFTNQINAVYSRKPLRAVQFQHWSGAICKAYAFGDGAVDWSGADELRDRLDALLLERRGSGLTVTRITRLYRSEARRVGKEGVRPIRSRWSPYH